MQLEIKKEWNILLSKSEEVVWMQTRMGNCFVALRKSSKTLAAEKTGKNNWNIHSSFYENPVTVLCQHVNSTYHCDLKYHQLVNEKLSTAKDMPFLKKFHFHKIFRLQQSNCGKMERVFTLAPWDFEWMVAFILWLAIYYTALWPEVVRYTDDRRRQCQSFIPSGSLQ